MGKYTSADIKRIANAMRRQKGNVPDRPYSLLIGAGCSKTAGIPLASELVQEIKREYKHEIAYRRGKDCDDDYGACMAVLAADEIRAILTPHLDRAGVNWGHIAIASLMDAGYVGRVLTFNFDSILARACGLLGLYPATYDFATGAPTRTNYIVSPAILHLHGQGHGHALLNSEDETYDHARALRLLLTDTLSHYPLLVAGYSGESDAVFAVLKDLFDGEQRLCWAGYETDCPAHVRELLSKRPGSSDYIGEADSDQFFVDLATELECWPPRLFTNPYAHMLKELKPVIDYPGTDTDILSETRAELENRAKDADAEQDTARDLFLKGDYQGVVDRLGANLETEEDHKLLGWAQMRMANHLGETIGPDFSEESRRKMLSLYDQASQNLGDDHTLNYNWGLALQTLAEQTQDQALFRESFDKYAKATEINPDKHEAFNNWGVALQTLAQQTQDEALFRESFDKYAKATEIKPDKHEAFYNWGLALQTLAQQTQDEALFRESFDKYAKATEIRPDMHEAFNNWGVALQTLAQQTQDEALFRESFDKYAKATEIRPDMHEAFNNWGVALQTLAQQTQDEALFRESFDKYAKATEIRPDKHEAFNNWGIALKTLAQQTQDQALFRESFDKYAKATEINPDKHEAFNNWGSALSVFFQITGNPDDLDQAETVLKQAASLEPDRLYNFACLRTLQQRYDDAMNMLLHCETAGTLPNLTHLQSDSDLDPLREREDFKALLKRLEES